MYAGFKGDEPTGGMCTLTVYTHVHTLYNVIMHIHHIVLCSLPHCLLPYVHVL